MRAKTELKYTAAIILLLLSAYISLFSLLSKYYSLASIHFIQACKSVVSNYLSPNSHIIGLSVIGILVVSGGIFTLKTIAFLIQTHLKIKNLLSLKTTKEFKKLNTIINKHKLDKNIVRVVDISDAMALTYGLVAPKIIISSELINKLTEKELEAVILHEIYHIRNKHNIIYAAAKMTRSALFFLPVVKSFIDNMKLAFETEADNFAVLFQGTDKYIKRALVKTLTAEGNTYQTLPNFSVELLERRVDKLTNKTYRIRIKKSDLFATIIYLAFFVASIMYPAQGHAHTKGISATPQTILQQECPAYRNVQYHTLQSMQTEMFLF